MTTKYKQVMSLSFIIIVGMIIVVYQSLHRWVQWPQIHYPRFQKRIFCFVISTFFFHSNSKRVWVRNIMIMMIIVNIKSLDNILLHYFGYFFWCRTNWLKWRKWLSWSRTLKIVLFGVLYEQNWYLLIIMMMMTGYCYIIWSIIIITCL